MCGRPSFLASWMLFGVVVALAMHRLGHALPLWLLASFLGPFPSRIVM